MRQRGSCAGLPQHPAAERVPAGAALEQLQPVAALAVVARADLSLPQHGLTDASPEVTGAAQTVGTVRGAQTGVPDLTCRTDTYTDSQTTEDETHPAAHRASALTSHSGSLDLHPPSLPPPLLSCRWTLVSVGVWNPLRRLVGDADICRERRTGVRTGTLPHYQTYMSAQVLLLLQRLPGQHMPSLWQRLFLLRQGWQREWAGPLVGAWQ